MMIEDLIFSAIYSNNHGATLLLLGRPDAAIEPLIRALKETKWASSFEQSLGSSRSFSSAILTLKSPAAKNPPADDINQQGVGTENFRDAANSNQRLFCKPFYLLAREVNFRGPLNEVVSSIAVAGIFNLALAYHLEALRNPRDYVRFRSALDLYENAHSLICTDDFVCPSIMMLAVLNNLTLIFLGMGRPNDALGCRCMLISSLMYISDRKLLSIGEMAGFFDTAFTNGFYTAGAA